jgi:hypothetical protein
MDFQGLKVGDFVYFERLTASIKVICAGVTSYRELIKTKYI